MRIAAVFCDHMVLQQGMPVPVWGSAAPGERITVRFGTQTKSTVTGKDGRWNVVLASLKASRESRALVVESKKDKSVVTISDVVVGDVWICSGQSNMEWPVHSTKNAAEETAAANYPALRLCTIPRNAVLHPADDIHTSWEPCTPESVPGFSAVGYFFGREIHRKTGLPIGLINASWGGTIAEAWTNRDTLVSDPFFRKVVKEYEFELSHPPAGIRETQEMWAAEHDHKDTFNAGEVEGWQKPEFPDAEWPTMDLPRNWQSAGHVYSGVFWFRREVEVPPGWAGRDLTLSLGPTDKSDVTYFNGVKVGSLTMEQRPDAWCTPRVYTVPGHLVKAGRNVVAVRVFSNIFHGGFIGAAGQMKLIPVKGGGYDPIPLAGPWRYRIEANFGLVQPPPPPPRGAGNPNSPYMLFENMIKPLVPFAIRGAIWYQGESNADRAKQYHRLFPLMIRSWREAWKQGRAGSCERDFPFLFVQLANYMPPPVEPVDCAWAELREAQLATLAVRNAGMAVAIDLGETGDIHPKNKQDVGCRLALPALSLLYGFKGLVSSGPLYRTMKREGDRIRLEFDHVAGGLVAREGTLKGFAIAGADRKFVWAEAVVEGDTVVVSSPKVRKPVAVRYAWDNNPYATLYNASDLPASPFRTDSWPGITA